MGASGTNEAFRLAFDSHLERLFPKERSAMLNATPEDIVTEARLYDAHHRSRSRTRRYTDRFVHVVDGFKGYFAVVSTIVQSNPQFAALAWGGVLLIVQAARQYSRYFEKITQTLEKIAEDLFFFHAYATDLYTERPRVQRALEQVYNDILEFCLIVRRTFFKDTGVPRSHLAIAVRAFNTSKFRQMDIASGKFALHRESVEREAKHADRVQMREVSERLAAASTVASIKALQGAQDTQEMIHCAQNRPVPLSVESRTFRSSILAILLEFLENIAWHVAKSAPGLAPDLVALLCVCRPFNKRLSFATNPRLYARIFTSRLDTAATARRLGVHWLSSRGQAIELRRRFSVLRRIRAGDVCGPHLTNDLWTAYLMMSENDGANEALLCGWAGVAQWVHQVITYKATLPRPSPASWFCDTEGTALALWVLWWCEDKDVIANEAPAEHSAFQKLIYPFLVAGFKYPSFYTADAQYPRFFPPGLSSSTPRSPSRTLQYFGRRLTLAAPPLTPAAMLAWMGRNDIVFCLRNPTGSLTMKLKLLMPSDRAAAMAIGRWHGPTLENIHEYEQQARLAHPRRAVPYPLAAVAASMKSKDESALEGEPSRKEDEQWGRMVACCQTWASPSILRGKVYTPGTITGFWCGTLMFPELVDYKRLLQSQYVAGMQSASGAVTTSPQAHAPPPDDRDVRMLRYPSFVRLQEHHCLHPTLPMTAGTAEWNDDWMDIWWSKTMEYNVVSDGIEVVDPTSGRISRWETFHPGDRMGGNDLQESTEILEVTRLSSIVAGERVDDAVGVANSDVKVADTPDRNAETPDEQRTERPNNGLIIEDEEDYEDLAEESEMAEILVTGETESEHGFAWGNYRFVGRVRPWDGLVVLLRYSMHPTSDASRQDPRRLILRGYLHGDNFVGRWREAGAADEMAAYEGPFVLTRRSKAA